MLAIKLDLVVTGEMVTGTPTKYSIRRDRILETQPDGTDATKQMQRNRCNETEEKIVVRSDGERGTVLELPSLSFSPTNEREGKKWSSQRKSLLVCKSWRGANLDKRWGTIMETIGTSLDTLMYALSSRRQLYVCLF